MMTRAYNLELLHRKFGMSWNHHLELKEEFDFDGFYTLATRVLNEDTISMANLNSLKDRWDQKFKMRKNSPVATQEPNSRVLKPVAGRSGTPFRPRVSLLPRRNLSGMPAWNGDSESIRWGSAKSPLDSYYEQENLGKVTVLAAVEEPNPVDGDVGSSQLMVQDNFRVVGGRGAGSSGFTETHDSTAVDNIAGAFLNSSRKTLHFVPPTKQNGEIIVRPTKEVVENGSKKWHATAVGYFLGRKPYFPHLEAFVRSNWKGLQSVSATTSGFYFFRFRTRVAMEEIIEGGPWLFQGQPIVLQFWEQGMSLRRQKHTQVPVWIRLKHLPMEYWTDEGLSTVASGVGTPLYTDGITKECSRLDFARVCVMLNYTSSLPKHLIVISPILRDGKEDPKRVDIEYEWLPQRCKLCCSLGHVASTCPDSKKTNQGPPITIFVKKQSSNSGTAQPERGTEVELTVAGSESKPDSRTSMIKVASWNVRGLNGADHQRAVEHLVREYHISFIGLIETRVSLANVQRVRLNFFYEIGLGLRIILARLGEFGGSWGGLRTLAVGISDEPWLVLGDFNAVLDDSEVRGRAADTSVSMAEFRTCMLDTGLVQLPFTGCPYTWHNCSEGTRSLWKRLDRMLVNEAWLEKWPGSSYISALPRTEMYEVVCKLKALKAVFRQQRKQKGNLTENVKLAKGYLDKAQELFAVYRDDVLLHLVKCCRMVYSEAIKLELSMLKQRAKLRWMKHGDQNSKVFFRKINSKRAKHMIFQITNAAGEGIDLSFLRTELKHTLTLEEANLLIRPVTREEIKEAIFDIDEESAPGPDGTGQLLKQVNTTVLALIPKVNLPSYVSDYRPISCCNVLYKVITKVIVQRMQPVLHLLIDHSQTAFVPGRSIADNILLAQELLAGYNQRRLPPRCTLKVDIQKAYDSVEWDFLLEVLRLFNFPPRFVGWIEQCVSTASFSVSINGAIYGFFKGGRGLRQGDPMSPYLFVLVMEIWNSLLRYRVQNAAHFQYHWKCKELGILNLCFADDVLLFCKAHIPSIQVLKDTLNEFAALSGLNVNPEKSQIILSRAVQQERQQIIDCLGFQEGFLPIRYLGVPLTSSRLTIADCRPLLTKVDTRLAGWSHHNLSYAGRVQLIRSVLNTLHIYWASVFILPKGIISILEGKMRKFLWQGPNRRGNAKVAWDQICKPKEEGGLGIRSMTVSNKALMMKHLWRLLQNDGTSIWVEWIQLHRLQNSTLWTFNGATGSWGWKKMLKLRPILQQGVLYKIGNGSTFKLWQDIWHERGPLCQHYPLGPAVLDLPLNTLFPA
ncbi:UNVERIFIED_CONTAM: hypothetical protein Sangu_3235000 [Sesamum angustifolium]|uniref:Reverse transcriptase domain-containing protein n=1 Tax=Sesamum angustifolium TaxID=2727405 RepID=A0AAW2JH64_9LAMI